MLTSWSLPFSITLFSWVWIGSVWKTRFRPVRFCISVANSTMFQPPLVIMKVFRSLSRALPSTRSATRFWCLTFQIT